MVLSAAEIVSNLDRVVSGPTLYEKTDSTESLSSSIDDSCNDVNCDDMCCLEFICLVFKLAK